MRNLYNRYSKYVDRLEHLITEGLFAQFDDDEVEEENTLLLRYNVNFYNSDRKAYFDYLHAYDVNVLKRLNQFMVFEDDHSNQNEEMNINDYFGRKETIVVHAYINKDSKFVICPYSRKEYDFNIEVTNIHDEVDNIQLKVTKVYNGNNVNFLKIFTVNKFSQLFDVDINSESYKNEFKKFVEKIVSRCAGPAPVCVTNVSNDIFKAAKNAKDYLNMRKYVDSVFCNIGSVLSSIDVFGEEKHGQNVFSTNTSSDEVTMDDNVHMFTFLGDIYVSKELEDEYYQTDELKKKNSINSDKRFDKALEYMETLGVQNFSPVNVFKRGYDRFYVIIDVTHYGLTGKGNTDMINLFNLTGWDELINRKQTNIYNGKKGITNNLDKTTIQQMIIPFSLIYMYLTAQICGLDFRKLYFD